jgi:hypothetical protein
LVFELFKGLLKVVPVRVTYVWSSSATAPGPPVPSEPDDDESD